MIINEGEGKMTPYSLLVFNDEITEETSPFLESQLKQGIKVFFFTYDPLDELLENKFLKDAKKNHSLYLYETIFHEDLQHDFSFYNNEIPQETLEVLAKQTPEFNEQQYVVEHAPLNENIMVSAGAGTGKTTVMINRILYLKFKNPELQFSDIALVTFTNVAAHNMRDKLLEKLKTYFKYTRDMKYLNWLQELKNMPIGTIHSFAETVLSLNKDKLVDATDLRLTSFTYRRRKIIEEVIDEYNLKYPEAYSRFKYIELYRIIKTVEMMIDQVKNHSVSDDKLLTMNFGQAEDGSNKLYEYVVKETSRRMNYHKKTTHSMDVNDLIIAMDQMVESTEVFHIPYKYIFIDEFQDTDQIQTKFFAHIANTYPVNLFLVGDVKQSIYRFRGADYTAFQQLKSQTSIKHEYYLQKNYRTTKNLLDYMNKLFASWPEHVASFSFGEKDHLLNGLPEATEDEQPFVLTRFDTTVGRMKFLEKLENTDTGVLVRTNKQVNELARLCEENNIFYTAEQDGDFYRSVAVRELYLLIKRFTHPQNWKNRYALHMSSYGERTLKVNDILEQFSPDRSSHALLAEVDSFYEQYTREFQERPVFVVLNEIISKVNPADVYANRFIGGKAATETTRKQGKVLRQEYQMNLDQLLYLLKKETENTIPTLFTVERMLRIKMQTDKSMSTLYKQDLDIDRLKIMTVHKAKGLEFDHVFLPHTDNQFIFSLMTDVIVHQDYIGYYVNLGKGRIYQNNMYKSLRKQEVTENIGEETRLLYVALTRAKKQIFVDAPSRTNSHLVKNWGDLIAKGLPTEAAFN